MWQHGDTNDAPRQRTLGNLKKLKFKVYSMWVVFRLSCLWSRQILMLQFIEYKRSATIFRGP